MRTFAPIRIKLYPPETPDEKQALRQRVAEVHAAAAVRQIQEMNLPAAKKTELLQCLRQKTDKSATF